MKNCTYYFFNDMINIQNVDPNKIKIDEKSFKNNILIHYIRFVTIKVHSYAAAISVKISYLLSYEINGYIEESNLKLVPTDENQDTLKMYKELWNKIRDLINSY